MKHEVQQETELRRYLLGELPLEEQVLVEQRLFLDSDYAELLQAVEDDLIDEYLTDELEEHEREKFKNHFLLLPEHSADLRIAQALKKYLTPESNPSPASNTNNDDPRIFPVSFFSKPFVWLSVTVAALILFSIVAWLVFRAVRGPSANAPMQANDSQPVNTSPDKRQPTPLPKNDNREETADKGNTNGSGPTPENSNKPPERQYLATKIEPYTLTAGGPSRAGGSTKKLAIYTDTKAVRLTLPLEFTESYEKYRAELMRGARKINTLSVTSQPDVKPPSVSVEIPADILQEQRYWIKLYGIPAEHQAAEFAVEYHFAVEKKSTVGPGTNLP
jgi:hypothetical protein